MMTVLNTLLAGWGKFCKKIIMKQFLSIILWLAWAGGGWCQSVWDLNHLRQVKQSVENPSYEEAFRALCREADKMLGQPPVSVMMKDKVAASGDKHDYLSQARYVWPDPTKPDGLPYVHRDGVTNPEIERLDRPRLGQMSHRVVTLTLAWYFSGKEQYAQEAARQLRAWFLNRATRMNPNLNYAQVVPGVNQGKGRCYGLIDSYSFVEMLDAVQLLEQSRAWTAADSRRLKRWFRNFAQWMTTSPQGREEDATGNNHSIAYDAQLIAFSLYAGRGEDARRILGQFAERRLRPQIQPDGSQPHELRRTLAYHYSWYNLNHIIDILLMARHRGVDIGEEELCFKALDFLCPYVGQDRSSWPYQQISGWDEAVQHLLADLYRAATLLPVGEARSRHYLCLCKEHLVVHPGDRFWLLYAR